MKNEDMCAIFSVPVRSNDLILIVYECRTGSQNNPCDTSMVSSLGGVFDFFILGVDTVAVTFIQSIYLENKN